MGSQIIETTFLLKRGSAKRWAEVNPVLKEGEPGFVYDSNQLKIGDGKTPWNELPFIEGATGIESVNTYNELPAIGNENILYRVADEKTLYQYNATTRQYESLSGGVSNIDIIFGGNA